MRLDFPVPMTQSRDSLRASPTFHHWTSNTALAMDLIVKIAERDPIAALAELRSITPFPAELMALRAVVESFFEVLASDRQISEGEA